MVALAVMPEVGAVGAKLLYPNGRVQHGGVVLGVGGIANHFNHRLSARASGYFGRNLLVSDVSAVTAACLVVKKSAYVEAGGLNETDLPVAFNDVDFCLRLSAKGYRNVWTPHAVLVHHESATRGPDTTPANEARFQSEINYMRHTWHVALDNDPFYNANLSTDPRELFQVALPRRRRQPWMTAR